jgi:demethylmenaquinone methyltransferase/2-methoxy-6-polyprenyl-1,4-benzoquinol methylase
VSPNYDEQYVAHLFDRMSPTYDAINLISSFGFSESWRAQCVRNLSIPRGATVADLMSGSGECWTYLRRRLGAKGKIFSVDFSRAMCDRQKGRLKKCAAPLPEIYWENALSTTLRDDSVDFIISAFGLKTFDAPSLDRLAREMFRILRPGGGCSLIEISVPPAAWLRALYVFYIKAIIPLIGRMFLGDIECYRMLGIYTEAFGSCAAVMEHFQRAGFDIELRSHFFGCASSIIARKKSAVEA